jgi:hypothetical protein
MPLGDEFDARGLWRSAAVSRRVLRLAPTPEGRHSERMEIRQVRYFLAVVDTLNLTRGRAMPRIAAGPFRRQCWHSFARSARTTG